MNTVLDHINHLPSCIRDRALKQTSRNRLYLLATNMTAALSFAFSWTYSEEGEEYWKKVCEAYDKRNPYFDDMVGQRAPSEDDNKDHAHVFPLTT